jgi:TolB protein
MRQQLMPPLGHRAQGLVWLLFVAGALALAGCGGDGGAAESPPPVETVPVGTAVTQTIGTTGGTVQATASGMKISLSFPDGALAADTVVTLTPQAPAQGDVVSVKLAPGGTFFAKPVTVVLEYPAGQVPDAKASLRQKLGSEDSFMVTTVDAATRTLSAMLTTFGGTGLDALARPAAGSASAPAGRAMALGARALETPAAPSDGTLTADASVPLAEMIASIRRQVTILENVGDFEGAFALQASIASLLMRRGDVDFPVTATPFITEAHGTACAALSAAMAEARAAQVTKVSEFKPLREKIGNWWVIADQTNILGTGCPGATIDDFSEAAIDLTTREAALQAEELRKVKEVADPDKKAKIDAAAAALKIARKNKLEFEALHAAATALDLPPLPPQMSGKPRGTSAQALAVHDSGYAAIIQTVLLDPLMVPAREAAWTMAKGSATLAQYPPLIDAFGSAPALQQDAQFVRTRIEARINSASGDMLGRSVLGFDVLPDQPADPKRSDTLTLRPGTTLALSGNIANLECASAGDETLKVTFDDVQVASVSAGGGNLLAGALASLTPTRLLQAAGLRDDDTGSHTLRVRRSVSPCAAALGITDDLLATVTLSFAAERKILFARQPYPAGNDGSGIFGGTGIESVNADGTGRAVLTVNGLAEVCVPDGDTPSCSMWATKNDHQPTLSPDGRQLLFSRVGNNGQASGIMLANADGSGQALLTNQADSLPSWSPDGRRIAFVRSSAQQATLLVMNIDGSNALQLGSSQRVTGTAWSPDGKTIAFGVDLSDTSGVYVVAADGSSPASRLLAVQNARLSPSAWSPDGTKIAFGDYYFGSAGIINADGTGLVRLDALDVVRAPPAWSPDGSELAFFECPYPNYVCAIFVMKPDGTGRRQLTANGTLVGFDDDYLSWR